MSAQYDLYLQQHKENVRKGCEWIRQNLPELLENAADIDWYTDFAHDASKSEPDEYDAYDAYFYGGNRSYKVVQEFNKAWLLHIHRNPHHWQHWVLINDDPEEGEICIDIPYQYIIEMICDWWSFSWQQGNLLEIFNWYGEHKDHIKLSDTTRKTVENILDKIRDKISEDLTHHGIKGQKWGVKNGPPYPLKSNQKRTIVKEAIDAGDVLITINKDKQKRHTKTDHLSGRSYLNGDLEYAQDLINKLSGTGSPVIDKNGNWVHKERVAASHIIGTYVNREGNETQTNKAMIDYSKTGTHIYPRKEKSDG